MVSNKKLGTAFEGEVCDLLSAEGYWVHFIVPDARGAQPFDIIAVKSNNSFAIDCKTCEADTFTIKRLEDNQIYAFEKWLKCGNTEPLIAVKHNNLIYLLEYSELKKRKSIKLDGSIRCISE